MGHGPLLLHYNTAAKLVVPGITNDYSCTLQVNVCVAVFKLGFNGNKIVCSTLNTILYHKKLRKNIIHYIF
jgi:hypothetical protein